MLKNLSLHRIKTERIAKGLTQEALSNKLKWSKSKYARYESGSTLISINEFQKIIKALGISEEQVPIFFTSNLTGCKNN